VGRNHLSNWIKKELRGGKHYPGGEYEGIDSTLHDLNEEFKTSHGELSQKIFRVPRDLAKQLAEACEVPLALGIVAYQVHFDGILTEEVACELLRREYLRLKGTNYAIPTFESAELDFAIKEGQWLEYLYKRFVRQINDRIPTMTTIEGLLNSNEISIEKILMIIYERNKITKGLIAPVLHRWVSTHRGTTAFQGALVVAEAILKSPVKSEKARLALTTKADDVRKIFDKLKCALKVADFSLWSPRELEPIMRNINDIEDSLSKVDTPFETMSEASLAELMFQLIPTGSASPAPLEKGGYVVVTSPVPRHGEIGPLLEDPYDFLERDIRLARQRDDSEEFLLNAVQKIHQVLVEKNGSPVEVALNMIMQMHERYSAVKKPEREELLMKLGTFVQKEQTEDLKVTEKVDFDSLYSFLSKYFIETFLNSKDAEMKETT
jgi:hypothetical protein